MDQMCLMHSTTTMQAPAGEEVLVLKHKVRVLEKRLETESKMARDFHTELCQLSKEHEYLSKLKYEPSPPSPPAPQQLAFLYAVVGVAIP